MKRLGIREIVESPVLYPISAGYISAVLALALVSCGALTLTQGVFGLAAVVAVILITAVCRELQHVHRVVDEQAKRIEHLSAVLEGGEHD